MRRVERVGALLVIAVVNALVLAGAAWNRSGAPDASLTLTERELSLGYGVFRNRENTGISLHLRVADAFRPPPWLDAAKLRALGFAPQRDAPSGRRGHGGRPLPRLAYVALEYDGPAWAALIKDEEHALEEARRLAAAGKRTVQQVHYAEQRLRALRESGSRLVAVDADKNAEALRARYPERTRYIIAPVEIRMAYGSSPRLSGKRDSEPVHGYISRILTAAIHVPVQFHGPLISATGRSPQRLNSDRPPRYAVVLNYGRRYEPWIVDVRPLR